MRLRITLITIICILATTVQAQVYDKEKVGLFFSLGSGSILNDKSNENIAHQIHNSSEFGITYLHYIQRNLDLETGISYLLINTETTLTSDQLVDTTKTSIPIINVPLGIRYTFSDYIFINGGALLSYDLNGKSLLNSQSGIGLFGGLGAKYKFKFGGEISLNPMIKVHSLIPFTSNSDNKAKILDAGIRLGFTYKIK